LIAKYLKNNKPTVLAEAEQKDKVAYATFRKDSKGVLHRV